MSVDSTPQIVSYSELDTYRQCPLKHHLAYKQRWVKQDRDPDHPLTRGTSWHQMLQVHYETIKGVQQNHFDGKRIEKSSVDWVQAKCIDAVTELLYDHETGVQTEQQAHLAWMYAGHLGMWGIDQDWIILEVENNAVIPLPEEDGTPSHIWFIKMKLDLLVEDRLGKRWLVDHKSAKNLKSRKELDIDDQFGLYTWGMAQIGKPVLGSIHSGARTQRNVGDLNGKKLMPLDERFARTAMFRSDVELRNLAMDAARAARASRGEGIPYSSPNPDMCRWKCDYLEAHMQARKGTPLPVVLEDFGFKQDFRRH